MSDVPILSESLTEVICDVLDSDSFKISYELMSQTLQSSVQTDTLTEFVSQDLNNSKTPDDTVTTSTQDEYSFNMIPFYDANESLMLYLSRDSEGLMILHSFKFQGILSDSFKNTLVRKIINRETDIILKSANLKTGEQLEKFHIDTSRFLSLTNEVAQLFNEDPDIYYSPFDNSTKTNATGKLWDRYNTVKKLLKSTGILKKKIVNSTNVDSTLTNLEISKSNEEKLEWLRLNISPWTQVEEYWKLTNVDRQNAVKYPNLNATKNDLGYFNYLCVQVNQGINLIHYDFQQLHPDHADNLNIRWDIFKKFVKEYSTDYTGKNNTAKALITLLPTLNEVNEDAAILLLFAHILKPSALSQQKKVRGCKRKVNVATNSPEDQPKRSNSRPTQVEAVHDFIQEIATDSQIEEVLTKKKEAALKNRTTIQPFIIFSGSNTDRVSFYVVVNNITFKVDSPVKALDLAFKIFFTADYEYPKASYHIWIFIQKVCYGITTPGNKFSVQMKSMISYLKNKMKVSFL